MNNPLSDLARETIMNVGRLFSVGLLSISLGTTAEAWAQNPGGNPAEGAARVLRRLDRNNDGALDPEELDQVAPLKAHLERLNMDVRNPIPLKVIADQQAALFQEMQERGQDGGGDGSPEENGPPNTPREPDRGAGDGGGNRPGRGGPGRGDPGTNAARGQDRRGSRGGRNSGPPGGPPGKADTKSKVRVGRVGPKVNLPPTTLPAQYAARDVNHDGQIGMYEWLKTDLSTFRRLDTNGDGLLVPAELAAPSSGTGGGSTTVAGTTPSGSSRTGDAAKPSVAKPAVAPSGPPADLKTVAAQGAFDFLDTDKNGQLTEDEWGRARYAKKLFTEAKVEVQFPLLKQKFVETYVKLAP